MIQPNEYAHILFEKFKDEINYLQTFDVPREFMQELNNSGNYKTIERKNQFIPLLKTKTGCIVSYFYETTDQITFMLPQVKHKLDLIKILFKEILFKDFSEYFPYINQHSWTEKEEYRLPGESTLLQEKETIKNNYERLLEEKQLEIEINRQNNSFLHGILIETGDKLVNDIIDYLKWLGFENILNHDKIVANNILEGDIQIDLGEKGKLIIEVKDIHGTSKDNECSQISKIKFRRCKEKEAFDVHALYIVISVH